MLYCEGEMLNSLSVILQPPHILPFHHLGYYFSSLLKDLFKAPMLLLRACIFSLPSFNIVFIILHIRDAGSTVEGQKFELTGNLFVWSLHWFPEVQRLHNRVTGGFKVAIGVVVCLSIFAL